MAARLRHRLLANIDMCIRIERQGRNYRLETELHVPQPVADVFAFFADPGNLNVITPEWLSFRMVTPLPVSMRAGLLLDYRLRLRGVPIRWQSEIESWDPPHRFVDVQRKGPYTKWVHKHLFRSVEEGTEVSDRVDYAVPGGNLTQKLFVERDLRSIFEYRKRRLAEVFAVARQAIAEPSVRTAWAGE